MKTILAVAALALPFSIPQARAMPVQVRIAGGAGPSAEAIPVSGGCGKAGHRGYYGACRTGGGWSPHGPNRLRRGGPGRASPPS